MAEPQPTPSIAETLDRLKLDVQNRIRPHSGPAQILLIDSLRKHLTALRAAAVDMLELE